MHRRFWMILAALLGLLAASAACTCGDDDDDNGSFPDDDTGADDDTGDDDTASDDDTGADDDTGDDDTEPDVSTLVASCKEWLAIGEGDKARLDCLEAATMAPSHAEANFGVVLSDAVHDLDMLSIVYDYLASFAEGTGPVKADEDNLLDNLLQSLLGGLVFERSAELLEYGGHTHTLSPIAFDIDAIPVFMRFEHVADLGSEFDEAELYGAEFLPTSSPACFGISPGPSRWISISRTDFF
ncbi:MAG: hypothetical protein M5R36_22245 [Deltaproteobacteria bacterium]|nr:hypothetical protein [Deltaproteobacteria bacterium]